jgi:hypothetical protein
MTESKITTVTHVEWNPSKNGVLKPIVHFDSVYLSEANLTKASGHNAEIVKNSGLGRGAKIEVVRSGGVIAYIKNVITPAEPEFPDEDYEWRGKDIILTYTEQPIGIITRNLSDSPILPEEENDVSKNDRIEFNLKFPTYEEKLKQIKLDGHLIRHVEDPDENMQIAAVSQHGYAIQFLRNPSVKVQLAAVRQNGNALIQIDQSAQVSEEVQIAAVIKNQFTISLIEFPTHSVQEAASQKDPRAIRWIRSPTHSVVTRFRNYAYRHKSDRRIIYPVGVERDGKFSHWECKM